MDAQELLEQLFKSGQQWAEHGIEHASDLAVQGKTLADQGIAYATENLNFPAAGPQRDQMLQNLGLGAAAGGLLALVFGTETGRRALGPALKLGSLAALGGLGYKVYSDWQKSQGKSPTGDSLPNLSSARLNDRSMVIVKAMIGAAKADGKIDEQERAIISKRIKESQLENSAIEILIDELQKPLDVDEVAATADSPTTAVEIYLASLWATDEASIPERVYLDNLANALKLEPELVKRLEAEAFSSD